MSFYGYKSTSGADIKVKADKMIAKLQKKNPDLSPVIIEGRVIAKKWWGKAWNDNLESYADFSNRLSRGKSYVKNHTVIDLLIKEGVIEALVMGSRAKPYEVRIQINPLNQKKWKSLSQVCNQRIDSLDQLLSGEFPKEFEDIFYDFQYGLFPSQREIWFDCSCPDVASMCKHVAAVLYGVGHRLDEDPMMFFTLRGVDVNELIKQSIESKVDLMLTNARKKSVRTISDSDIKDLFGLE